MKKLFFLLISTSLLLNSCAKDDSLTDPACEQQNYGTITVSNSSSNPYDFYIDNVYIQRINGGSITQEIQISEGNGRLVRATQVSGYVLYPTVVESSFNVISCSDYTWQVP